MDEKLRRLAQSIEEYNSVDKSFYEKCEIRRGLRNKDGTGVLVGITAVGDVKGYERENGKIIPTKGNLYYRGYSILDIVKDLQEDNRFGFEEVIYLLLFNKLPDKDSLDSFKQLLIKERKLPDRFLEDVILKIPGENIMNKMMRSMLTLYSFDEDPDSIDSLNVLKQLISLISKLPLIMAYAQKAKKHYLDGGSLVIHYPYEDKTMAENILHIIRDNDDYTDQEAKILDLMLIIHAEHGGGNNSAFATHVVTSSGTDTYSAIATGLASLKGPRHGGANLKVKEMLDDIKAHLKNKNDEQELEAYLKKIMSKEAFDKKGLIYGIGHAVYTLSDPRAELIKIQAKKLAEEKGCLDEYRFIANVEKIGSKLVQAKNSLSFPACANVDMYSGFVYQMLGIGEELYTPLFAVSRMSGWAAHRLEQILDDKIIRPAYKSTTSIKEYERLLDR